MGYGNYSHSAHQALASNRAALSRNEVFMQRGCHALMDPKGLTVRESRDSAEHPNYPRASTPWPAATDMPGESSIWASCAAT
jgi:hypothetical protein